MDARRYLGIGTMLSNRSNQVYCWYNFYLISFSSSVRYARLSAPLCIKYICVELWVKSTYMCQSQVEMTHY